MRKLFPLLFLSVPLLIAAKKPAPPDEGLLEKSIAAAGGYTKYQRIETISYDFEETRVTPEGPVTAQGRHFFKLHDEQGLRGREELETSSGAQVTVFGSSGAWRPGGGPPDPAAETRLKGAAFWLFLPHNLKEAGAGARAIGLGHLRDMLGSRLAIDPAGAALLPGAADLVLYLERNSAKIYGATYSDGASPRQTFLGNYVDLKNSISVPAQRMTYGGEKKQEAFSVKNLSMNVFLDEALFERP